MSLITLDTLAAKAGVSRATVSRALSGKGRMSPDTRARIQALAVQEGYRADPFLSALSSYRSRRKGRTEAVIGYLTNWPGGRPRGADWGQGQYFPAAAARAQELGYRLDEFSPALEGTTIRRLSDILLARGITGVIVQDSPHTSGGEWMDFPWAYFSCCVLGYSFRSPLLPRVTHSPYLSMQLAMDGLFARGFRRISLWLDAWQDERVNHQWSDAYRGAARRFRLPSLDCFLSQDGWRAGDVRRLLAKQRPDVVITYGANPSVRQILAELRSRAPGWFILDAGRLAQRQAGIDQNLAVVGRKAVDVVVAQISRRERGPISEPVVTQVTGRWKGLLAPAKPHLREEGGCGD
jgi:LacI family transcriptional regulator